MASIANACLNYKLLFQMIKIFEYISELDCFVVAPTYKIIANQLGLTEWNEVVWIGRYFLLDNDYGINTCASYYYFI